MSIAAARLPDPPYVSGRQRASHAPVDGYKYRMLCDDVEPVIDGDDAPFALMSGLATVQGVGFADFRLLSIRFGHKRHMTITEADASAHPVMRAIWSAFDAYLRADVEHVVGRIVFTNSLEL